MHNGKKIAAIALLGLLLVPAFVLVAPGTARAITEPSGQAGAALLITHEEQLKAREAVKARISASWQFVLLNSLVTAANTAAQRLAQKAAVFVASGGLGQNPLAYRKDVINSLQDVGLDAVSDFLNQFSKSTIGLGLCEPFNARANLAIKLGIARAILPPKPSCSWREFSKNLDTFGTSLESGAFLQQLSVSFEPGESALSTSLNAHLGALAVRDNHEFSDAIERITGAGFRNLVDPLSGFIKTPAKVIDTQFEKVMDKGFKTDEQALDSIFNNTDIYAILGKGVGKVFLSTLASKLIEKYTKGGILTGAGIVCKTRAGQDLFDLCRQALGKTVTGGASGGFGGAALAEAQFAQTFTPIIGEVNEYDILTEMSACDVNNRELMGCVIDAKFAAAFADQTDNKFLTVAEALKDNRYLDGNKPLISRDDKERNGSPNCYQEGYCYSNLVKMRKAGMLPVGWELAASSKANATATPLRKVVDNFYNCDPATGGISDVYPWCHLIDPNWVLKVPSTQCRARVTGQSLVAQNTEERSEVCADSPTCLAENADGNCTKGYGYCARVANRWRIDGDECPPQFNTCENFVSATGKSAAFLQNTLESLSCNEKNIGCRWYSTVQNTSGAWDNASRIYLTRKAADCSASGAGCTELTRVATTGTVNRVQNPSFEAGTVGAPTGWELSGGSTYATGGANSFDNAAAVWVQGKAIQKNILVQPNGMYTLSFYARTHGAGSGESWAEVKQFGADGTLLSNVPVLANPTCTASTGDPVTCGIESVTTVPSDVVRLRFKPTGAYERFTLTFATSKSAATVEVNLIRSWFSTTLQPFDADAVQLETGSAATAFHLGGEDAAGETVRLKVAPDYLKCTGNTTTDAKACAAYAPVCALDEIGCERYSPVGGGTAIPAVTSSRDSCDAACVGYSTFKQERSGWEADETVNPAAEKSRFPLYFIPTPSAGNPVRSCTIDQVGCDEFTNVEQSTAGGEARAYFTALRACRKPDAASDGTFYTWEGSDTSGYQLKSFTLRVRASGDAAIQEVNDGPGGIAGPAYGTGTDVTKCTKAIFDLPKYDIKWTPDCREMYDADGHTYYRLLSQTVISSDQCNQYRKTESTEIDCTNTGGSWNTAAQTCTYLGYAPQSRSCAASAAGCRSYTGNAGGNVHRVSSDTFESKTDEGWVGGKSSTESTALNGFSLQIGAGKSATKQYNTTVTNPDKSTSKVSTLSPGHFYQLVFWGKGKGAISVALQGSAGSVDFSADDANPETPSAELGTEWQRFSFGPVLLQTATGGDQITFSGFDVNGFIDNVELIETTDTFPLIRNSWRTPAICDQAPGGASLPQAQLGCAAYTTRTQTPVNLKSFDHLCREKAIGCEAFTDARATTTPFTSIFNARCTLAVAATAPTDCKVDGKTRCTVSTGATVCRFDWQGVLPATADDGTPLSVNNPDTYLVPQDTTRYLVDTPQFRCDATQLGCMAVGGTALGKLATCTLGGGAPVVGGAPAGKTPVTKCTDANGCACGLTSPTPGTYCTILFGQSTCTYVPLDTTVDGTTLYKTVKPSDFSSTLCTAEGVGCEQWTSGKNETRFFKDPGEQLCEYKERVIINSLPYSGFFKKGTEEPCDASYLAGGSYYGIWRNIDPRYAHLVGQCQEQYAGCTAFIDPTDKTPKHPDGYAYYYIKNQSIDDAKQACNGVSRTEGCVAFNDTSVQQLTINSDATYFESEKSQNRIVPSVDCSKPDNQRDVQCTRRCKQNIVLCVGPGPCEPSYYSYCREDSDCGFGASCVDAPLPVPPNDANIVMKVVRDRECSQWLECRSSAIVLDPRTGQERKVCDQVGLCTKRDSSGDCSVWSDQKTNTVLNRNVYADRNVNWSGEDYTGFSIPDIVPVSELAPVVITSCVRTARECDLGADQVKCDARNNGTDGNDKLCCPHDRCEQQARLGKIIGQCADLPGKPCSGADGAAGSCWNGRCVQNPDTSKLTVANGEGPTCRAYPEATAPFPNKVVIRPGVNEFSPPLEITPGFQNANVCATDEPCECTYEQVEYGAGRKVYLPQGNQGPDALCVDGAMDGKVCNFDSECPEGKCTPRSSINLQQGWQGLCLERDAATTINGDAAGDPKNKACLTWYPIDRFPFADDVYSQHTKAGFPLGNVSYCSIPKLYKTIMTTAYSTDRGPGCADQENNHNDCQDTGDINKEIAGAKKAVPNMYCGNGYFLEVSTCLAKETFAEFGCAEEGVTAFRCVPFNSRHLGGKGDPNPEDDGLPCKEQGAKAFNCADEDVKTCSVAYSGGASYGSPIVECLINPSCNQDVPVYMLSGTPEAQAQTLKEYDDCGNVGVAYDEFPLPTERANYYLACYQVDQVASADPRVANKAWTDRLWRQNSKPYTVGIHPVLEGVQQDQNRLKYQYVSPITPFGRTARPATATLYPEVIPACQNNAFQRSLQPAYPNLSCASATDTTTTVPGGKGETLMSVPNEARPFTNIRVQDFAETKKGQTCTINCYYGCKYDSDCKDIPGLVTGAECDLSVKDSSGGGRCAYRYNATLTGVGTPIEIPYIPKSKRIGCPDTGADAIAAKFVRSGADWGEGQKCTADHCSSSGDCNDDAHCSAGYNPTTCYTDVDGKVEVAGTVDPATGKCPTGQKNGADILTCSNSTKSCVTTITDATGKDVDIGDSDCYSLVCKQFSGSLWNAGTAVGFVVGGPVGAVVGSIFGQDHPKQCVPKEATFPADVTTEKCVLPGGACGNADGCDCFAQTDIDKSTPVFSCKVRKDQTFCYPGTSRIEQLFAKVIGQHDWLPTNGQYAYKPTDAFPKDITSIGFAGNPKEGVTEGKQPTPPSVRAVSEECQANPHLCTELADTKNTNAITVSGQEGGLIVSHGGWFTSTLSFYAWADPDQMPIKNVIVDFGDGLRVGEGGANFIKNHRGMKDDLSGNQCDGSSFGQSADACDAKPFDYKHGYFCSPGAEFGLKGCTFDGDNNVIGAEGVPGTPCWAKKNGSGVPSKISEKMGPGAPGACLFRPRVQIWDNWGWCNGVTSATGGNYTPDLKRWDSRHSDPFDPCVVGNPNAWTYFSGTVLVTP